MYKISLLHQMNDDFDFMFTNSSFFYVTNQQTMLFVFGLRFCTLWLKTSDLLCPQNTKYQISTIPLFINSVFVWWLIF